MLHGRGAGARDILSLASHFPVANFALLAPQATNNTWYPYSFMAEPGDNEPWLSSAIEVLNDLVDHLYSVGKNSNGIYFLGFSQGACLALEFVSRKPNRYGGVVAFTGGLIGDRIYAENYKGSFENAPVFIGTSDVDSHVPVERVYDTERIMRAMNADVTLKVYPGMDHTITADEIKDAITAVFTRY